MRVEITDDCISCGQCMKICSAVFEMGREKAKIKIEDLTADLPEQIREAAKECPVEAIILHP